MNNNIVDQLINGQITTVKGIKNSDFEAALEGKSAAQLDTLISNLKTIRGTLKDARKEAQSTKCDQLISKAQEFKDEKFPERTAKSSSSSTTSHQSHQSYETQVSNTSGAGGYASSTDGRLLSPGFQLPKQ